jgi:hypothetical protein
MVAGEANAWIRYGDIVQAKHGYTDSFRVLADCVGTGKQRRTW